MFNALPSTPINLNITAQLLTLSKNTTPETVFACFAKQPWAMWLDSCQSNHVDSRFDIIVWQPQATLITQNKTTTITYRQTAIQNERIIECDDEPLSLLHSVQQQLLGDEQAPHQLLPFLGGALGYFAYDLGRRFEKLPSIAEQDINLPEMAVGIYQQAIVFDNKTNNFYLVCPEKQRASLTKNIQEIVTESANVSPPFCLTQPWLANMTQASYIEKFNQVQRYLLSGDCYQINLAQRFTSHYQGDEFQAYLALRAANKAPFSAFIRLENSAILSVSPERFLQLRQGRVQSKPIKGTAPRHSDTAQDEVIATELKNSIKNRAENLMIVDLLRNDMSKVCQAGTVKVPKLFDIESFPAVHHLVSTVEGELGHDKNATDLLRGAFPGGSITGAPKIRAMEIIEELEPHRRSIYCGSIGYVSQCGTMDTSITIRTLVCQHNESTQVNTVHCWAGGGLVADSTALSEYQETFDKVNCILPVLSKLTC
ncbi:aminodeoxychorismate synthase component I [Colwellia sp. D2M02]|uniref:aminodeoxychorismate synthase component I n=1 Tax=Colwellia sp. D2M02 TaxID=2841562 RepID=UPI0020911F38|nr:aminodeoxychorismate synthase component I [Colwellia sp. D2M02]